VSGASMFLAAPFAARLTRILDLRLLFAFGSLLVAIGSWQMAVLTQYTGFSQLILPQFLRGMGFMFALVCCSTLSLSTLPAHAVKNASGLYSLMRNLGGALGLASINTIMFWRKAVHDQQLTESLTMSREPVRDLVLQMRDHDPLLGMAHLVQQLELQSIVLTYNDALIAIAWVGCLAIPLFLLVDRPKIAGGPAMG
jgi:DHA2 family multidrug resistance protein